MKGPQGYATIVNIAMNVLLGLIISIAVLLYMGTFMPVPLTAEAVIGSTVSSFFVGFAVGMLLPIMDWAFAIIGALKVKNGFVQYLIIACTLGACMGVCITCGNAIISQIGVGGWPAVGGFIASFIGFIVLCAVALVIVFLKPVQIMAAKISGFDPAAAMQPDTEAEAAL